MTTPRSPEREALVVFGFLLLLDWDFEAMGLSVMSLEGTQRVERQKKGAPFYRAPLEVIVSGVS
jgi:hypothetical protein